VRTRPRDDRVACARSRRRVGVCGWLCQIHAKDDHGFVRRGGGLARTGRIGAGWWTLPGRSFRIAWLGGFEDAPLGLVSLSGDPLGVAPHLDLDATPWSLIPAASCVLVRICAPRDHDRNGRARPVRLGAVGKALPDSDLVGGLPNGPRGSVCGPHGEGSASQASRRVVYPVRTGTG
jgi:hypothetical protein